VDLLRNLTAPSALYLALTALVILLLVAIVWLGRKPALAAAKATTDIVTDKRVLTYIDLAVGAVEQMIPGPGSVVGTERFTQATALITRFCPELKGSTLLEPLIEKAVLTLHNNLGIYRAQIEANQGAAQTLDMDTVKAELQATLTQGAIAAGEKAAQDKLQVLLSPLFPALATQLQSAPVAPSTASQPATVNVNVTTVPAAQTDDTESGIPVKKARGILAPTDAGLALDPATVAMPAPPQS